MMRQRRHFEANTSRADAATPDASSLTMDVDSEIEPIECNEVQAYEAKTKPSTYLVLNSLSVTETAMTTTNSPIRIVALSRSTYPGLNCLQNVHVDKGVLVEIECPTNLICSSVILYSFINTTQLRGDVSFSLNALLHLYSCLLYTSRCV